jgi:hypothetical protein
VKFGADLTARQARNMERPSPPPGAIDNLKWEPELGRDDEYRCHAALSPALEGLDVKLTFCAGTLVAVEMRGEGGNFDALAADLKLKYGPQPLMDGSDRLSYAWAWPDGGSIQLAWFDNYGTPEAALKFTSGTLDDCRSKEEDAASHVRRGAL